MSNLPPKKKFCQYLQKTPSNKNWTLLVVHYFIWKLKFFSNILSVFVLIPQFQIQCGNILRYSMPNTIYSLIYQPIFTNQKGNKIALKYDTWVKCFYIARLTHEKTSLSSNREIIYGKTNWFSVIRKEVLLTKRFKHINYCDMKLIEIQSWQRTRLDVTFHPSTRIFSSLNSVFIGLSNLK